MDALFLRQVWAGNDALLQELARDAIAPPVADASAAARLHYFLINKGPWSRLDHNAPFIPGVPAKPEAAQLLSRRHDEGGDPDSGSTSLSGDAKARGHRLLHDDPPRRRTDGSSPSRTAVEYQGELARAAALLREAAGATSEPTLKSVPDQRAPTPSSPTTTTRATSPGWSSTPRSNRPSAPTRSTRTSGSTTRPPSRRSSRCATTPRRTKLQAFSAHLQELENALPIDPQYRNPKLGALAPIRVVNVVFTAGDANRGVQTAAFNLPNDERVVREKGTKRVMLKNVQEAKFRSVLLPIAKVALAAADQRACRSTRSSRTS